MFYLLNDGNIANVQESRENDDKEMAVVNKYGLDEAAYFDSLGEADEFVQSLDVPYERYDGYHETFVVAGFGDLKEVFQEYKLKEALEEYMDRYSKQSYDVEIYDKSGNVVDGQFDYLASSPEEALEPAGGVQRELGEFTSFEECTKEFSSLLWGDIDSDYIWQRLDEIDPDVSQKIVESFCENEPDFENWLYRNYQEILNDADDAYQEGNEYDGAFSDIITVDDDGAFFDVYPDEAMREYIDEHFDCFLPYASTALLDELGVEETVARSEWKAEKENDKDKEKLEVSRDDEER